MRKKKEKVAERERVLSFSPFPRKPLPSFPQDVPPCPGSRHDKIRMTGKNLHRCDSFWLDNMSLSNSDQYLVLKHCWCHSHHMWTPSNIPIIYSNNTWPEGVCSDALSLMFNGCNFILCLLSFAIRSSSLEAIQEEQTTPTSYIYSCVNTLKVYRRHS